MKSKEEYSSEEVKAVYSEIINGYLDKGWNIISTDASLNPVASGIGIVEMLSEIIHKYKVESSSTNGTIIYRLQFSVTVWMLSTFSKAGKLSFTWYKQR